MSLTRPSYAVDNVQQLADLVQEQATLVKQTIDKTGADTKTFLTDTLIPEVETLDAQNVKLTGNQTVAGVKTFSSSPVIPTPTTDMQPSTKKYADDKDSAQTTALTNHKASGDHDSRYYTETEVDGFAVKLTGDQTIAGIKTFASSPVVPTPTTDMQTATKKYVDDKDTAHDVGTKHKQSTSISQTGSNANAEGSYTTASGASSHAGGDSTVAVSNYAHAKGRYTLAAHGASYKITGWNDVSKFIILETVTGLAIGDKLQILKSGAKAYIDATITGFSSNAVYVDITEPMGTPLIAVKLSVAPKPAYVEGYNCLASGASSHAEGDSSYAEGSYSHAEGDHTLSSGSASHSEGSRSQALGEASHAEGEYTLASGSYAHAEGYSTTASGLNSHAGGKGTKAQGDSQTAIGKYNVADLNSLFILGNGTSDLARSNAMSVDASGNMTLAGKLNGYNIEQIDPTLNAKVAEIDSTVSAHLAENTHFTRLKLHHDFSNKPNGNIASIDTKQQFGIYNNPGNVSGLAISSGKLVHGLPTTTNPAGYLEVALDNKITRMGATFVFNDANSGVVTLASFAKSIVDEVVNQGHSIPDAGIHVTVLPDRVSAIVYKGTGSTSLGVIYFDTPLSVGTRYNIEVFVDNQTLYIIMPDGSASVGFYNADIKDLSSNFATFELYEADATKIPASIVNIWADDADYLKDGNVITGLDVIKLSQTYLTVEKNGLAKSITDFNNAITTGFYQCGQNTPNAPSASSLHILVEAANAQYVMQYAWQMTDATKKYKRILNNGVWGSWSTCTEDASSLLTTDSSGNANLITDFNSATKTGFYQCNSGVANGPTTSAQFIQVISANSLYKIQYAWQVTDITKKYKRAMSNGTWGSWITCTE